MLHESAMHPYMQVYKLLSCMLCMDVLLAGTPRQPLLLVLCTVCTVCIYLYRFIGIFLLLPHLDGKWLGHFRCNPAGRVIIGCSTALQKIGPQNPTLPSIGQKTSSANLKLLELSLDANFHLQHLRWPAHKTKFFFHF